VAKRFLIDTISDRQELLAGLRGKGRTGRGRR
jgi:hypothetical protein